MNAAAGAGACSAPAGAVRVRILGPVSLEADGRRIGLGPQQRVLLAALVLAGGQAVSKSRLIELMWTGEAPDGAAATLRTHVLNLRRLLEPTRRAGLGFEVLVSAGGRSEASYALRLRDGQLDATRFVELTRDARRAMAQGDAHRALAELDRALALWDGTALGEVSEQAFAGPEATRLEELRLTAREERIDALLTLGRHDEAIGELTVLIGEHRMRERLWSQLILALYRSGRQAEALAAYREIYRILDEELGVEPGRSLRDLHQRVLLADPGIERRAEPAAAMPVPRQIPADVASFTGRAGYLRLLDATLPAGDPDPAQTLVISSVTGTAGVGKTTLAVHWMHRVAGRFPDGQLYVNLRGYASGSPVAADEALSHFLRALGVAAVRVPEDCDAKGALYRSLLAGKRMLVLLDNAAELEQVRPLLPGSPTCLVVVTSRNDLRGLTAFHDALHVDLDVFSEDEAITLLARTVGEGRVRAEPEAASELVGLCGYLPLALRVCAANLIGSRHRRIADLTRELREGNRLAALNIAGERRPAVQGAFDLSYAALPAAERRLFRLLSLVPGPDVTAAAAGALIGAEEKEAERLLDHLAARHLVSAHQPGRYRQHDLLRVYARDRAEQEDGDEEREAALRRLLVWYLSTTARAGRRLFGQFYSGFVPAGDELSDPVVRPVEFADLNETMTWLSAERSNLLSAMDHAAEFGPSAFTWQIADALHGHLMLSGERPDWARAARAGLRAAEKGRSAYGQAAMHDSLGNLCWEEAEFADAVDHAGTAVALYEEIGYAESGIASECCTALVILGAAQRELGGLDHSEHSLTRALRVMEGGEKRPTASALAYLGYAHADRGRFDEARERFSAALLVDRETGSFLATTLALRGLGFVHRARGRAGEARRHLTEAVDVTGTWPRFSYARETALAEFAALCRDTGGYQRALEYAERALHIIQRTKRRTFEAEVRNVLGTVLSRLGDLPAAEDHHRGALEEALRTGCRREQAAAYTGLAAAHRELGREDEARAEAEAAARIAAGSGFRLHEGEALAVLGALHLGGGALAEARRLAEGALAVHRDIGYRLGASRALQVLGDVLAAEGRSQEARRRRAEAARTCEDIGAPPGERLRAV
ncbi:AfsR/SARP family transcriptional regulator [Streptomyces sp. ME19-01-6]|uniref:AfsR/SARP family transcriptional regulator n=1 Tax=Streptomyces sp. ME19-01-6 TaxID=3028686 RepID=UPI0029C9E9FA|nr:BTAD domain-containing putative transcriptional regulator [Streptomyces sp. ME19-01-6]